MEEKEGFWTELFLFAVNTSNLIFAALKKVYHKRSLWQQQQISAEE